VSSVFLLFYVESYLRATIGTFLFDIEPIPETLFMEFMFTLEDHTVIFHFLETNSAALLMIILLVPELDFLGQQD
jgi:hypothetical protein